VLAGLQEGPVKPVPSFSLTHKGFFSGIGREIKWRENWLIQVQLFVLIVFLVDLLFSLLSYLHLTAVLYTSEVN